MKHQHGDAIRGGGRLSRPYAARSPLTYLLPGLRLKGIQAYAEQKKFKGAEK